MSTVRLSIDADISYAGIPVPDKVIIPVGEGKLGSLSYKQHDADPLAIERLVIQHAGGNRIKLSMRGTGRVSVTNFPDLRIGGTKMEVESELVVQNLKLLIQNPQIVLLDIPNVHELFDNLLRHISNEFLLKKLSETIDVDLKPTLQKATLQINQTNTFDLEIGKEIFTYGFNANAESFEPHLKIASDGIHIKFDLALSPSIKLVASRVT